ncbi:MAG: TrmH family RNA methyltransferase [Candidatus Paceibacterota bacterium]|jgi:tRNA G18 (ribose-2'-O)-methylase SpoU
MKLVGILSDIRSLHNVGSMFRTADGVGIEKLYLCGITPEPFDRFGRLQKEFSKTALGSEKNVEWEYRKSITKLIKKLKSEGCMIYAIEQAENSTQYNKFSKSKKKKNVAFIVGNEVSGIPKRILNQCDEIFEIPMRGAKESLNVSVAFGIVAYELKK